MAHWKEHLNSTLLGAYSCYDEATEGFKEIQGVIMDTAMEDHILGASGKKRIFVAHTSLGKPLKINNSIASQIAIVAKTQNAAKWINIPVTFFVDEKVKFGGQTVAAIRVKAPKIAQQIDYSVFILQLENCKDLNELKAVYSGFEKSIQVATVQTKDKMKGQLQ